MTSSPIRDKPPASTLCHLQTRAARPNPNPNHPRIPNLNPNVEIPHNQTAPHAPCLQNAAMAPPGQRTFVPVPTTVGIQSLIARPEGEAVVSHRPMTSRDVKEAYRKRTAGAPPTDEELRRQRLVAATDKKEREKEKASAKARAAREKKAEKERAEQEEKKRKGLPVVEVTASQATLAGFFRGGGMERRREVGGVDLVKPLPLVAVEEDKENQESGGKPPAKKQKVEEGERKPMQRAPSRKKIFGQNLPFKGQVDAVRGVDHKQEHPRVSPSKMLPTELVRHVGEKKSSPRQPSPKLNTESAGPQPKERVRSSPVEKETTQEKSMETKAEPAMLVTRVYMDTHKLEGNDSAGNNGRRAERNLGKRKLTPAREGTPSSNMAMTMNSMSEPSAFSKPTSIAKPSQAPTATTLSRMPPPERMRSEPVDLSYPLQHRRSSPPLYKGERGLSQPHHNPATTHLSSANAPGRGPRNPQGLVPPSKRPHLIPSKPGRPSVGATTFAQPLQKPLPKPSTTPQAVPPHRAPVAYPKYSVHSPAPPITAASYGYLPPAQPRDQLKPAAPGPIFVRPARPEHPTTVPAFKSKNVSTGPTGFHTPKFLPSKHVEPSTSAHPGMGTAGLGAAQGPPLSTQRFLELNVDSFLPSPSQEERELRELSAAPLLTPAFINDPRPVVAPRPPQFKSRPPVPAFNRTPAPRPNPAPRQSLSVRPVHLTVQQMEDPLPFISTQDWVISSQDMREVESDTPSKPPHTLRTGPRPSPLGNNMTSDSLVQVNSPRPFVSSTAKGLGRNRLPRGTHMQPGNLSLPSVGNGPAIKGLPQQAPKQAAHPPAASGHPTLSPFGSCSERPKFFDSQESVDPQEFMNLVAENIKVCHDIEQERRQPDKSEGCVGEQGAGVTLSQETDYGDLGVDLADLMEF